MRRGKAGSRFCWALLFNVVGLMKDASCEEQGQTRHVSSKSGSKWLSLALWRKTGKVSHLHQQKDHHIQPRVEDDTGKQIVLGTKSCSAYDPSTPFKAVFKAFTCGNLLSAAQKRNWQLSTKVCSWSSILLCKLHTRISRAPRPCFFVTFQIPVVDSCDKP